MFLPKLLIAGAICVGCGVPVAYELLKKTEFEGLVFSKADEATEPILTCIGTKSSNIQLSLAYKNGTSGNKELYWKGKNSTGEKVDFDERIVGEHHQQSTSGQLGDYRWVLKIFGSGNTRLYQTNEYNLSNHEPEEIICENNIFEVANWTFNAGERVNWSWEKPVTLIKLTPDKCQNKNGKQECEIKISEDVGLSWKPTFKPKAIF